MVDDEDVISSLNIIILFVLHSLRPMSRTASPPANAYFQKLPFRDELTQGIAKYYVEERHCNLVFLLEQGEIVIPKKAASAS